MNDEEYAEQEFALLETMSEKELELHRIHEEYFVETLHFLHGSIELILKETNFEARLKEIGVDRLSRILHDGTKREMIHEVLHHVQTNHVFERVQELYELFAKGVWHETESICESMQNPEFFVYTNLSLIPFVERIRGLDEQ